VFFHPLSENVARNRLGTPFYLDTWGTRGREFFKHIEPNEGEIRMASSLSEQEQLLTDLVLDESEWDSFFFDPEAFAAESGVELGDDALSAFRTPGTDTEFNDAGLQAGGSAASVVQAVTQVVVAASAAAVAYAAIVLGGSIRQHGADNRPSA